MKTQVRKVRRFAAGLLVTSILAGPASAQAALAVSPTSDMQPRGAVDGPFGTSQVAGDDTLGRATAREDISLVAQSDLNSNVSNNEINGDTVTGDISFSDTAFANSGGLTIVNANSGNNVGMNASINVNLVMIPAAAPQQ